MARKRRPLVASAWIRLWGYMTYDERVLGLCIMHQVYLSLSQPGIIGTILLALLSALLSRAGVPDILAQFIVSQADDLRRQDLLDCSERLGPPQ